jgi:serine/threonine protein kinase
VLDGRYSNITVVNCNPATGDHLARRGCLSVVFRARDLKTDKDVAIKFFDPDFSGLQQSYRLALFQRECDLLQRILGKPRCLQLHDPLSPFPLTVSNPATSQQITLSCYYFVIEWLDGDIDDYFFRQQDFDAIAKLGVFRSAVLAILALHQEGISHRDVKADNLRKAVRENIDHVVAIDLGTAAAYNSQSLGSARQYADPVGAAAWAPLECHCGLAGVRSVGPLADFYALGCLLFELFNVDLFAQCLANDSGFQTCFTRCCYHMKQLGSASQQEEKLIKEWRTVVRCFKRLVTIPKIDSSGSTVPAAVRDLLDLLLRELTAVDFEDRLGDGNKVLRRIDTAIRVLNNSRAESERLKRKRQNRMQRETKVRRMNERLEKQLGNRQLTATLSC